ncbi:hypothetical protein DPX16_1037 [Anabarilius grahami]|uniref:Myb/SANT-like DNA-binding domain-containing protein n=1 Tax=Anabarilius grahami TaxID=495550 RepID=A0A3N0XT16_ANAGA|nr:hypothetical protein DPX16_1037 [Anabarilius grahami]
MLRHRHPSKDCSNVEDPRNFKQGLSPSFEKYPIHRKGCIWTKEQTEAFIRLRVENKQLFTGGRDTAANGYRLILEKMGLEGRVSHAQAKKKWDNLKTKYKECKCPATGQGTEDGKATAANWPWFALMEEALGQSAAVSPPCLIASIQEEKPGPSTAQEVDEGRG